MFAAARRLLEQASREEAAHSGSARSTMADAEELLLDATSEFERAHRQLTSYVERTERGGDLMIGALETTKLVAATAVIMGTGAGAAGLAGTAIAGVTIGGAGSVSGMTAIAGASALSAGAMAGAYTTADQLSSEHWDPVAIARSAGAAAASTFLTSMLGGALNAVFMKSLGSATAGLAGHLGAEAQAMLDSSAADRFLGLVAGSVSGGLVAATEAAVRQLAAGQHMSREELCKIVLIEAVKSGLLQLAVSTALARTKMAKEANDKLESKLVDRSANPDAAYGPDDYVLHDPKIHTVTERDPLPNVHELLAPAKTDHNHAFYPKQGSERPEIGLSRDTRDVFLGTDAKITRDTLYVSAHGAVDGMAGGNRELAHLTANTIAKLAERGDPVARVVLNSCLQRDKRFGIVGKANGEVFEALLKQAMKAHPEAAVPPVYTMRSGGSTSSGAFGPRAFVNQSVAPAAEGGRASMEGAINAGSHAAIAAAGATIAITELTDLLSEHPSALEQAIQWLRRSSAH